MILGVFMGFIGMGFWFWSFNHALSRPMGLTELIEIAVPRVTILIFIELLAEFFLRQYRIGVEDFKYFFEIEQRAAWKRISYSILFASRLRKNVDFDLGYRSQQLWPAAATSSAA